MDTQQHVIDQLDRLADARQRLLDLQAEKQKLANSILPEHIKMQLAELDAEFAPKVESLSAFIAATEKLIRDETLLHGATIKGHGLMAVWNKARVSWDTKSLDGYAVAHPEILALRKEGEPSVAIREITTK